MNTPASAAVRPGIPAPPRPSILPLAVAGRTRPRRPARWQARGGLSVLGQALAVAKSRYDKGAVSYLDVTEAERTPLATERALAQLRGAQWAATAQLVKALGGGWGG